MRSPRYALILLLCCFAFESTSFADNIYTLVFSGIISESTDPLHAVGSQISGSLTYDMAATFTGGYANQATYESSSVQLLAMAPTPYMDPIGTETTFHHVQFMGWSIFPDGWYDGLEISNRGITLTFLDADQTVFASSLTLPNHGQLNSQFEHVMFTEIGVVNGSGLIRGMVDVKPIPEPTTLALLGAGLCVVARFTRSYSKHRRID